MTTEEKAKAYDEALSKCKAYIDDTEKRWSEEFSRATEEVFKEIFPELRESEDERIRKELIEAFEAYDIESSWNLIPVKHILAWLEKQKEQKPDIELIQRSWYMEGYHDREFSKEPKWIIKTGEGGPKHELNPRYGQPLAEQKPAEWSEEDDKMVEKIICSIWKCVTFTRKDKVAMENFMKSLRPSWKPSEEQMKALGRASTNEYLSAEQYDILVSLYEHLKKLI